MSTLYATLFALLASLGLDPTTILGPDPGADAPTYLLPPPPAPQPVDRPKPINNDIYNGF